MSQDKQANPSPLKLPFNRLLARPLERLLKFDELQKCYDARPKLGSAKDILQHTMTYFDYRLYSKETLKLPPKGPVLVVANHPLGGLEGVALTHQLLQQRSDTKVLTNQLLLRIPELQDIFIGLDVLSKKAPLKNVAGLRQAKRHLSDGGLLLVFPAGSVSRFSLKKRRIEDQDWNILVGTLASRHQVNCLPAYIRARNSKLFYFLSLIHPLLGTLLLSREFVNKRGKTLEVIYGQLIPPKEFRPLKNAKVVTSYLRINTELLSISNNRMGSTPRYAPKLDQKLQQNTAARIAELSEFKLLERGDFSIYCAPYERMGTIMKSIGLAREFTFRAEGEGSGNDMDLDQFDPYYKHLFVWDQAQQSILGGYRIGHVREIVNTKGVAGLYSRTLYKFNESYLKDISHALELGRSFIHPNYQRLPASMDMLWRGIGAYVAKNPEFHTLFGSVSISRNHSDLTRALMADTLLNNFGVDHIEQRKIKPISPLKYKSRLWSKEMLNSLNQVSLLNHVIGKCDPGKAVPVLIRHYLSLNGKLACFTVDPDFNETLAGLIIVDIRNTPIKYIRRYLGTEGAERFLQQWGLTIEPVLLGKVADGKG